MRKKLYEEWGVKFSHSSKYWQSFFKQGNLEEKLNWKFVFQSLKDELDSKMNRERMKGIRISEKWEMQNFLYRFSEIILNLDFDHSLWYFGMLLIWSYFMIFVMKVYETEGRWLWVETSFNKCLWGEIIVLGQKRWCFMLIIQRRICCWHFCVMQMCWRKIANILRFSCFKLTFVN